MSLSSDRIMKLMAYADGELHGAELAEAEQLVATDAESARFVAELTNLAGLVGSGHDDRYRKAIESFDVADAVMSLTESSATVTSLASRRQRQGAKPKPMLSVGFGVAAALALAASVLLFLRNRSEEVPMATGPARLGASSVAVSPPGPGVSIESAGNSVSVFYLPTANELSTSVVVWVDETGEK